MHWIESQEVQKYKTTVVDLSFIVTHTHQKIKDLFHCINFDYYDKCCENMFFFLSLFEYKKTKKIYTLVYFINFVFIFTFFLLQCKKIYALKLGNFLNLDPDPGLGP